MPYDFEAVIVDVPDFPKPGITFKDITPVLSNGQAFAEVTGAFADRWRDAGLDAVVGIESRGFIFGASLAHELGIGMVIVRKPGKLPRETFKVSYDLEYGSDTLEIHKDSFAPGAKVLIIDDVLATGGTAAACVELVQNAGGEVAGCGFVLELDALEGRSKLPSGTVIQTLVHV